MKNIMSVQTAEKGLKEPKKTVQPVTEATPSASNPFDLSKLDPKTVAMAEKMGIPLNAIMIYLNSVEERFRDIESTLPGKVADALQQRAAQRQAQAQAAQPQQTQQAKGGGADLNTLLQLVAGGGGEQNSQLNQLAMESLRASINQGNAITAAVISKITGKAVTDVAASLTT